MQTEIHVPPAHPLLDELKRIHNIKYDNGLHALLGISPPEVSRVRKGIANFSAGMILAAHEHGGMPVAEIRRLLAQ